MGAGEGQEPITLEKHPELRDSEAETLFDETGVLMKSRCSRTAAEARFAHPFRDYYAGYCNRMSLPGVFTPYDATIPVSDSDVALEGFRRAGLEAKFPRFSIAGARERYCLDPAGITVGIVTAGGNAPGLNCVIDSIVKRQTLLATAEAGRSSRASGLRIRGYLGGYEGLIARKSEPLDYSKTDRFSTAAGSMLKMRRGRKETGDDARKLFEQMARAVTGEGLDVLYVIGGNGTIHAAAQLCRELEQSGAPTRVVAAPKTMDNDVNFTDVSFGFRTTVENAVETIRRIHVEAETCERIGIIELFGAASGFVALHAAYASGEADYVLIPELMRGDERRRSEEVAAAARRLAERYRKNGHALLVVAEGASHHYAHGSSKEDAFDGLRKNLLEGVNSHLSPGERKPDVCISRPAHLVRSTPPNAYDIDLCKQTGKLLVDTALAGFTGCVVSSWHGRFVLVPMETAVARLKRVDVGSYYFLSMMEKYMLRSGDASQGVVSIEEYLG